VIAVKIKQKQLEDITTKILEKQGATLTKSAQAFKDAFKIDPNKQDLGDNNPLYQTNARRAYNKQKEDEKKLQQELNSLYKDQNGLFNDLKELQTGVEVKDNFKEEKVKKVKGYKDIIEELRKTMRGLQAEFEGLFIDKYQFDEKKVQAYANAVKQLGEIKAPTPVIIGIEAEVFATQWAVNMRKGAKLLEKEKPIEIPTEVEVKPEKVKINQKDLDERLKAYTSAIELGVKIPANFSLVPRTVNEEKNDPIKEALQKSIKEAEVQRDLYVNTMQGLFENIGTTLGDLFSGKNLGQELFSGIFNILGTGIQELGKKIISTSTLMLALKKLFKVGDFGGSIIVGIGMVALGGIIKGAGSSLKFASGGYVSGDGTGTSDSIPARLSNGEYVIKASTVNQFGKGFFDNVNAGRVPTAAIQGGGVSEVPYIANFKIQGSDLAVILARANLTNSRNS
jgi:hypothetical protein